MTTLFSLKKPYIWCALYPGESIQKSIFHYASVFSGPFVACICGMFLCLIPFHDVLKNPDHWYEEQAARFMTAFPLVMSHYVAQGVYWSNFSFDKPWISSLYLVGLGCLVHVMVQVAYFVVWTYLGLYQPMPFNGYLGGGFGVVAVVIAMWFR